MICVDTSVWVAALRDGDVPEARELALLLEDDQVLMPVSVRIELLSGARSRDLATLRDLLPALRQALPGASTWSRIDGWLATAAAKGHRFAMGDLLVAAMAAEHGAPIWSLDQDFHRMARLGFVSLAHPGRRP